MVFSTWGAHQIILEVLYGETFNNNETDQNRVFDSALRGNAGF